MGISERMVEEEVEVGKVGKEVEEEEGEGRKERKGAKNEGQK